METFYKQAAMKQQHIRDIFSQYTKQEAANVRTVLIDLCQINERTFYRWLNAPEKIKHVYLPIWMAAFRTKQLSDLKPNQTNS